MRQKKKKSKTEKQSDKPKITQPHAYIHTHNTHILKHSSLYL